MTEEVVPLTRCNVLIVVGDSSDAVDVLEGDTDAECRASRPHGSDLTQLRVREVHSEAPVDSKACLIVSAEKVSLIFGRHYDLGPHARVTLIW